MFMRMSDISGPPIARADVVRDVHHGITLDDAYRWMEADGEEFHRWLDGQASHAREQLDTLPRREELLTRIRERGGALPQYSDVTLAGDRIFYLAREPGASRCRILAHITGKFPADGISAEGAPGLVERSGLE
ncbi:hypothetical protein E1294_30065 [Nonomuraea diastatica]|uniref:Peptidase S9A N-terminal domain-containing protein n=2 Tax=Nonomuraea diastatica TaxID=1848329 RepID=A0A4R4WD50_9ACTN|nr:hypothetical protein E1294_30065 [Nonomuraea diastatica]